MNNHLMTQEEAAAYLKVKIRKLRRLTYARALPSVKLSPRVTMYKKSDLDRFIEKRTLLAVR